MFSKITFKPFAGVFLQNVVTGCQPVAEPRQKSCVLRVRWLQPVAVRQNSCLYIADDRLRAGDRLL